MHDGLHERRIGFYLSEEQSGKKRDSNGNPIEYMDPNTGKKHPLYYGEEVFFKHYFTNDLRIYSDKISKFVVKCNEKTNGEIIQRIVRMYPYIFIDEIQDLAG